MVVWGETVRGAQVALHAQESRGNFAGDLLRRVTVTVFFQLQDYTAVWWLFSDEVQKTGDSRTTCLMG